VILAYLPEPQQHPLWNEIRKLIESATDEGVNPLDPDELVWIAFEGTTLFGVATTVLLTNGEAQVLTCSGFEHRRWIGEAERLVTLWARDCGARKITMRGRMGWARYFRAFGWDCSRDGELWAFEKVL